MAEQQDDEATVIQPRRSRAPEPPLEGDAEDTVVRLIEPAAPARGTASMPPPSADHEPAWLDGTDGPDDAPPTRWAVRVRGSATVVPLDRPVVVGRRPGTVRMGEHPEARRLVVPAECTDVSARHARLEQLGETLVVADLGSTNGTVVHWTHGAPRRLRPGESCAVLPDALIELGERITLEFLAAASPPTLSTSEPPS